MNPFTVILSAHLVIVCSLFFAHLGCVGLGISVSRLIHSKNLSNIKTMASPWSLCATNADRIGLTILLVELLILMG